MSGQKAESCARDEQPYPGGDAMAVMAGCTKGGVGNPVTAMTVTIGFIRGGGELRHNSVTGWFHKGGIPPVWLLVPGTAFRLLPRH